MTEDTQETELVDLFVYGTLRPTEYNYRVIADAVVETIDNVRVDGTLYHLAHATDAHPVYPVADLVNPGPGIVGTLLTVDANSRSFLQTHRMETGAGYEAVEVMTVDSDGVSRVAIGYHYLRDYVGPQIMSGDWTKLGVPA